MKKQIKKVLSAVLAMLMLVSFTACANQPAASSSSQTSSDVVSSDASSDVTSDVSSDISSDVSSDVTVDKDLEVKVMTLSGTTGFGMASLMDAASKGNAQLNYTFSVETDASNVLTALVNGSTNIAALPTNAAATVYKKTEGKVKLVALNTLGVLYLLKNSDVEIASFEDLKGKTVYAPAQNPTFIFQYLCEKNGLKVGEDVIIDNTYAQPADLRTAFAAGDIEIAVLPEPMVTIAKSANENVQVALDLTKEWDKVSPEGSLVQGCVVARADFIDNHKAEMDKFLEEYEASVNHLLTDADAVSQMIETTGIFNKAAVAKKAIPNCNVCFIKGADMKARMEDFFEIMFAVAPASVGGAIPDDNIYYIE